MGSNEGGCPYDLIRESVHPLQGLDSCHRRMQADSVAFFSIGGGVSVQMEEHTLCDCTGRGQGHSAHPTVGCISGKLLLVSQAHEDGRHHTVILKSEVWGRGGREERGRERVNHSCLDIFPRETEND